MSKLFPFWWLNPVVTCDTVKACIEGDYSAWTKQWVQPAICSSSKILVSEANDRIILVYVGGGGNYAILKLSDGTTIQGYTLGRGTAAEYDTPYSFSRYFAVLLDSDRKSLCIYKDCLLIQTIDLSTVFDYSIFYSNLPTWIEMSFTNDGKYLAITTFGRTSQFGNDEIKQTALLKGA